MTDLLNKPGREAVNSYGKVGVGVGDASSIISTAQKKYDEFQPKAIEILKEADVVVESQDLDGVIFSEYTNGGSEPVIDEPELRTIPMHMKRINRELAKSNKKAVLWLNTNRELPVVEPIMKVLDPENSQGHMAAALEGGHVLGYQVSLETLKNAADVDEATDAVKFADGGRARIVKTSENGQVMVSESLLEAPHLRDIRLGQKNLTVAQARDVLVKTFEANLREFGENAWMPQGRDGMVTVRGVDPAQVVAESGQDISNIKKWHVPNGSPIIKAVREALELGDTPLEELPFELIYYPFDGGFDVQFKGLNKQFGQKALVARMKSLGVIHPDARVAVVQNGDSGSDGIEFVDEKLKITCVVLSVANADKGLIEKSSLLATYPHRKGVRQGLYVLGTLAKALRLTN